MKKNELRKIYKQKRADLSANEVTKLEQNIYKKVIDLDFSAIENVHIFLPIEKQKEINTYPIIDFLRQQNKQIVISKSNFKDSTLTHFYFDKDTILEVNKWGIPEPKNAKKFNVKDIDLVFIPMLISDKNNYRVGYGKGFYDRFLSECRNNVKTIGLNFFKPISKIEDVNKFDVSLDKVIFGEDFY